jgi:colanic acid biosynthesis protein WcaH
MKPPRPAALQIDDFADVVRQTPLVSIDLIVTDQAGRALVGLRRNPPAQGAWFVPGGRIRKDELLIEAWGRITQGELGVAIPFSEAAFVGVFEHLYANNFLGNSDFTTHYVVLAYRIGVDRALEIRTDDQHEHFVWLEVDRLLVDENVHDNTKAYFGSSA